MPSPALLPTLTLALLGFAGFAASTPKVTIRTVGEYRLVEANGIPNHATGRFPSRDNPNAIAEKNYVFRLTLKPADPQQAAERAASMDQLARRP